MAVDHGTSHDVHSSRTTDVKREDLSSNSCLEAHDLSTCCTYPVPHSLFELFLRNLHVGAMERYCQRRAQDACW